MPTMQPPEFGTLVIAALLLLALAFAGSWVITYVRPDANPWALLPWFGIAAAGIVVFGLLAYVLPRRNKDDR
jgi:hypothetical protein